jgi:DNA-binding transcriptional ArsR family regulator
MTARDGDGARQVEARCRLSAEGLELVTERLRIIAEPTRVRILWHLEAHGGATVQQVCDGLGAAHQNVSKHLRVLYGAGLVSRSRQGNGVRYELSDWSALWIIEKMSASVGAHLEERQERFSDV